MLRYPDGKREQISLPEQAKLLVSGVNWNPSLSTGNRRISFPVVALLKSDLVKVVYPGSASTVILLCFFHVIPLFDQQILLALCVSIAALLHVHSSSPKTASFLSKITLNGCCINH